MPIRLTPFTVGNLCCGCTWEVDDVERLAALIAAVAIGQSSHVEKIIAGAQLGPPVTPESTIAGAVALLTVQGRDPSHRDGWLFQVMSWLAARTADPDGLIRSPQMRPADKGFDGLQLEVDANSGAVRAAVIFEDKATARARPTIRNEVWPALSELETGTRDNQLAAEIALLLQRRPNLDATLAIQNVIWKSVRTYRVSITVGESHGTPSGRVRLFKGYDTIAVGGIGRRQGHVFKQARLRPWMQNLAERSLRAVTSMAPTNV